MWLPHRDSIDSAEFFAYPTVDALRRIGFYNFHYLETPLPEFAKQVGIAGGPDICVNVLLFGIRIDKSYECRHPEGELVEDFKYVVQRSIPMDLDYQPGGRQVKDSVGQTGILHHTYLSHLSRPKRLSQVRMT